MPEQECSSNHDQLRSIAGSASAAFNTFRPVGGAVAIAVAVFAALIANPDHVVQGLRLSLGIAATLLLLLAALSSLRIQPRATTP